MGDTPVILTDERRSVIEGQYDGKENTRRSHKSNVRARSKTALKELTEVAESPEIDHTDVFSPDDVFLFLRALLTADERHLKDDEPPMVVTDEDKTEEFRNYENELYVQLSKFLTVRHNEEGNP